MLRKDGTVWLNLGDSMATGVGANINNLLATRIKEGIILNGARCTLTITTKSDRILKNDKLSPDHILTRFLGIKRILIKQGNNHLCQILDGFTPIADCWISSGIIASRDEANAEIILDSGNDIRIVVSEYNLDTNSPLKVSIPTGTTENCQASLAIKEPCEPMPKSVRDIQTAGNTISIDASSKSITQVDLVDQPITLTDTLVPRSKRLGNLRITKASLEHLAFTLMDGLVEVAFRSVAHLFISNSYGSLIRYGEVYHQTKQLANERKAKQELGIPDMIKRALMRDGWICRSTIIWHKTNPMPESVTDRPTKAHEYVFLLTKNKTYFYDADAIREASQAIPKNDGRVIEYSGGARSGFNQVKPDDTTGFTKRWDKRYVNPAGRNRRTVWAVATHPYNGAHFATFPPKLIEPMILAGTSAKGACPKCGAAWRRVVEKLMEIERKDTYDGKQAGQDDQFSHKRLQMLVKAGREAGLPHDNTVVPRQTTGWQPTCTCDAGDPIPCLVLDPFAGTSTVGQVCIQHRRSFVGLELNRAYIALAQERTNGVQVRMEL